LEEIWFEEDFRSLNFNIYFLLQRETDGLKIKTKMLEDQTETIRKLKEVRNNMQTQRGKKQNRYLKK